jgi:hypothetical protein
MAVVSHPPYSPDLPFATFLISENEIEAKGRRFQDVTEIQ